MAKRKQTLAICGAKTRAGGHCRRTMLGRGGRCHLHGGKSTGPRTRRTRGGKVRAVGVFKRAVMALPGEQRDMVRSYLDAESDTLESVRRQGISVLAASIACALGTLAIGQGEFGWLKTTVSQGVTAGELSQHEADLILSCCFGPDGADLARAMRTLYAGIRDADNRPWELLALSLIKAIMQSESIETLRDSLRQWFIKTS